jgi:hypothetical protein
MRKTVMIAAALAAAAYLLRRSRRFGPIGAMAGAVLLEQAAAALRAPAAPAAAPAPKPSLWTRLTAPKPPGPDPA